MLDKVGGWPVLVGAKWNESSSNITWQELLFELDSMGFLVDALVEMMVFEIGEQVEVTVRHKIILDE